MNELIFIYIKSLFIMSPDAKHSNSLVQTNLGGCRLVNSHSKRFLNVITNNLGESMFWLGAQSYQ